MKLVLYTDSSAFDALQWPWQELFRNSLSCNAFLSWEWFAQWWRHFAQTNNPYIVTFQVGGETVAILPMMSTVAANGAKETRFMGSDQTTDYSDILALPGYQQEAIQELALYFREQTANGSIIRIEAIPAGSPMLGVLPQLAAEVGVETRIEEIETCPKISLPISWEEYLASLGRKDRHELKRKMRRLLSSQEVDHQVLASREEVRYALDTFYDLHARSHQSKARFMNASMRAFFTDMAQEFADRGWLRLAILRVNQKAVASAMSFQHGETMYLYNSGYDPEFRNLSAGIVLVGLEIRQAIEAGFRTYDFLRGNEPYKYDMGAKDSPVYRLTLGSILPPASDFDPLLHVGHRPDKASEGTT